MKKILTIADLHGITFWKDFADIKFLLSAEPDAAGFAPFEPEYTYVFLGDYTDSFTETNQTIRENLLEIIRFKKLYPNNVILLWGNHDVQYYLNGPWNPIKNHMCSGYRPEMHFDLYDIFNNNRELFQLAYQVDNYLFSHSGVHFGWYHYVFTKAIKDMEFDPNLNIAEQLNEAFNYRVECLFDVDWYRGGYKRVGGPLWCDKKLMDKKPIKNMHQIVGHSNVDDIRTYTINESTSITFCDCLHKKKSYYSIVI